MPILTLQFKDNVIKEYDLEKGKSLSIGRREENNIVIDNLAVSGHHAKIDSVGEGFLVTDLQSKNGSFVNEQLISAHWLKHGDVITVGKHSIVFAYKDGEARPETANPEEDMDQTMVMKTNSYKSMLAKSPPSATSPDIAKTQAKEPIGVLSYVAGGQGEVEISKKLFKIGKASANDIVVSGFLVGQVAATISKRPDGYFFTYAGGTSKPKVNGVSVTESVQLKDFDVIEIGSAKMHFFVK
ncbi:MAG: FHA domain-containing protein [Proteobacteria bacterium]|nr:FHA domain-containing protein [Pseudomonadota bacterium]MBU1397992.1 FHA domain-containing protein [Pseudomonadota bacterium]